MTWLDVSRLVPSGADGALCPLCAVSAIWCRWLAMPPVCWFCLPSGADRELYPLCAGLGYLVLLALAKPVLCGGGALLPGPGWDQEHPPSGFAIQAKEKEESGCKDCKGLANCHNFMACVNPLLACSRLVSRCCELHTGGTPTCVPFSPPSPPVCPSCRPWSVFSLPSPGGGALLPGPGWDQEHPPSGFAIQAKEKEESGCKDCKGL